MKCCQNNVRSIEMLKTNWWWLVVDNQSSWIVIRTQNTECKIQRRYHGFDENRCQAMRKTHESWMHFSVNDDALFRSFSCNWCPHRVPPALCVQVWKREKTWSQIAKIHLFNNVGYVTYFTLFYCAPLLNTKKNFCPLTK